MRTSVINGLTLPRGLIRAIDTGLWRTLGSSPRLQEVFNRIDLQSEDPQFYDEEMLVSENKAWTKHFDPKQYLGKQSHDDRPGDVDPDRAVIIAGLGPDLPVVLDYRRSPPAVLYYVPIEYSGVWIEVSATVDDLVDKLSRS